MLFFHFQYAYFPGPSYLMHETVATLVPDVGVPGESVRHIDNAAADTKKAREFFPGLCQSSS
jgi:hypothetical protein